MLYIEGYPELDYLTNLQILHLAGLTGKGITIGIIEPYDKVQLKEKTNKSFIKGSELRSEHGNYVSGIIVSDNTGIKRKAIAPKAKLYYRTLNKKSYASYKFKVTKEFFILTRRENKCLAYKAQKNDILKLDTDMGELILYQKNKPTYLGRPLYWKAQFNPKNDINRLKKLSTSELRKQYIDLKCNLFKKKIHQITELKIDCLRQQILENEYMHNKILKKDLCEYLNSPLFFTQQKNEKKYIANVKFNLGFNNNYKEPATIIQPGDEICVICKKNNIILHQRTKTISNILNSTKVWNDDDKTHINNILTMPITEAKEIICEIYKENITANSDKFDSKELKEKTLSSLIKTENKGGSLIKEMRNINYLELIEAYVDEESDEWLEEIIHDFTEKKVPIINVSAEFPAGKKTLQAIKNYSDKVGGIIVIAAGNSALTFNIKGTAIKTAFKVDNAYDFGWLRKIKSDTKLNNAIIRVGNINDLLEYAQSSNRAGNICPDRFICAWGCFPEPMGIGTSYSSPFIAGIIALLLEKRPDFTAQEITHVLLNTAYDLNEKDKFGVGIPDCLKACSALEFMK